MSMHPGALVLPFQAHRRSPTVNKYNFTLSPRNDCETRIDMLPLIGVSSSYSSSNYHTSTNEDESSHSIRVSSFRNTSPPNSSQEGDTLPKQAAREGASRNRLAQKGQTFLNEKMSSKHEGPHHQVSRKRGRRTQTNGTQSSNDESMHTDTNLRAARNRIDSDTGDTNEDAKYVSSKDSLQRKQTTNSGQPVDLLADETAPICEAIVGRPHATFADAFAYLESMYPARIRGRPSKETLRLREVIAQHETALWNEIDMVRKNGSKELSTQEVDRSKSEQSTDTPRRGGKDPLDILDDGLFFDDFAEDLWNAADPTFEPSSTEKKRSFHSSRKNRIISPRKRKLGAHREGTESMRIKSLEKHRRPKKNQRTNPDRNEINIHELDKTDEMYDEVEHNINDSSPQSDERRQTHVQSPRTHSDVNSPSSNLVRTTAGIAENIHRKKGRSEIWESENNFMGNVQEIVASEVHLKTDSLGNENEMLRNKVIDLEAKLESECSRAQELDEALKVCIKPDEIASQTEYEHMSNRVAELEEDAEERERERTNETDRFETLLAEKQAASSAFLARIKELENRLCVEQECVAKSNGEGEQAVIRQQAGQIASLERIIEKKDAEILVLRSESNTQKLDLITLHNTIQELHNTPKN